jgi:hypothetical protein
MPEFDGDFTIPGGDTISWTFLGWSQAVVLINKLPLDKVQRIELTREFNTGTGTCSVTVADPDRLNYVLFQPQDEIEIYFSTNTDPPIGLKVWGGFLDNIRFDISGGEILELRGKEYASRFLSQRYNGNFNSTDLGQALRTILATQTDFSYEGVPTGMAYLVSATFDDETMFNSIKQLCDQYKVYFWIDPTTRDVQVRQAATIVSTPDVLIEGENLLRKTSVTKNSESLTNDIIIKGDGVSTPPIQDSTSIANRGTFSRVVTVGTAADMASAQDYGQTTVDSRKDPINAFDLECLFLPYTDPGEYIQISSTTMDLNGVYQVLKVTHSWAPNSGIRTTIQVNNRTITTTNYVTNLERRLQMVEKKAYM